MATYPYFSLIIPVYNRPIEIDELLNSCLSQDYKNFEVIIIEDGSSDKCNSVADKYLSELNIKYYEIDNCGQGFARNYGYEQAKGKYWITLDSDVLLPKKYLSNIADYLGKNHKVDAFGGADKDHESFSLIQKAISFSLTSFITTGGIRGRKKSVSTYHLRSFNMGITPNVFEITKGYKLPFKGEDIDFSIRVIEAGFNVSFIENAFVYHKRRTSWQHFFRQMRFFGAARSNLQSVYPKKAGGFIYMLPSVFLLHTLLTINTLVYTFIDYYALFSLCPYVFLVVLLFFNSLIKTKNFLVSLLVPIASFLQLWGYGLGYLEDKLFKDSGAKHHSPEK